jgi:hypothetical protein
VICVWFDSVFVGGCHVTIHDVVIADVREMCLVYKVVGHVISVTHDSMNHYLYTVVRPTVLLFRLLRTH